MKSKFQFIVIVLMLTLIFKLTAVCIFFAGVETLENTPGFVKTALAEPPPAPGVLPVRDVVEDPWREERALYQSLEEKQKALDLRESSLKEEEKNLAALKEELTLRMEQLSLLEKKLDERILKVTEEDNIRYKDLAKVFETTPPAKAGVMLEKLDTKTAAIITMNMKREKAGAIWGYLSPQKAVEITREISRTMNATVQ